MFIRAECGAGYTEAIDRTRINMAQLPITDAALPASAPAFVTAPSFVFAPIAPAPTRSELLRRQIDAARGGRSATMW